MRTNVVLDPDLSSAAMRKAGVTTMRETIDLALRAFVAEPDYAALLALGGTDVIAPDYDPKAGAPSPARVAERPSRHRARPPRRR
jgi:hypothetical protein